MLPTLFFTLKVLKKIQQHYEKVIALCLELYDLLFDY